MWLIIKKELRIVGGWIRELRITTIKEEKI